MNNATGAQRISLMPMVGLWLPMIWPPNPDGTCTMEVGAMIVVSRSPEMVGKIMVHTVTTGALLMGQVPVTVLPANDLDPLTAILFWIRDRAIAGRPNPIRITFTPEEQRALFEPLSLGAKTMIAQLCNITLIENPNGGSKIIAP